MQETLKKLVIQILSWFRNFVIYILYLLDRLKNRKILMTDPSLFGKKGILLELGRGKKWEHDEFRRGDSRSH